MSRRVSYIVYCIVQYITHDIARGGVCWVLAARRAARLLCGAALCLAVSLALPDGAQLRAADNPFSATEGGIQSSEQSPLSDPLKAYPATQYVVHGVVIMGDEAVAVVYTPDGTWHRLQHAAHLGLEQAVVRQITMQGIQIEQHGSLLWLLLRE